jgi:phosphoribosyl-ATP pyrophosphohydrolase/phosphoribosyl-AMP cyclohydrolase
MDVLDKLYETVQNRKKNPVKGSYVSTLMQSGQEIILGKIEEESYEVMEAVNSGSKEEIVHEIADLLFHLLVLMGYKDISLKDIKDELLRRKK